MSTSCTRAPCLPLMFVFCVLCSFSADLCGSSLSLHCALQIPFSSMFSSTSATTINISSSLARRQEDWIWSHTSTLSAIAPHGTSLWLFLVLLVLLSLPLCPYTAVTQSAHISRVVFSLSASASRSSWCLLSFVCPFSRVNARAPNVCAHEY